MTFGASRGLPVAEDSHPLPDALRLEVFRSPRHELMYLYLPAADDADTSRTDDAPDTSATACSADLGGLPEALLQRFGTPQFAFAFTLSRERELATADAIEVLRAVVKQGFYLQMPPALTVETTPDAHNPHEHRP